MIDGINPREVYTHQQVLAALACAEGRCTHDAPGSCRQAAPVLAWALRAAWAAVEAVRADA